jgi:hypothetical protein
LQLQVEQRTVPSGHPVPFRANCKKSGKISAEWAAFPCFAAGGEQELSTVRQFLVVFQLLPYSSVIAQTTVVVLDKGRLRSEDFYRSSSDITPGSDGRSFWGMLS